MIVYFNDSGSVKVPKDLMTENPAVVVGPTTPPRPSILPDEHPPFEADDEDMLVKDYQDPSKPFRPATKKERS
eukprot:12916738-Prorocentrum_lima.AAC.1